MDLNNEDMSCQNDSDDDEWFLDSLNRYNELHMFDFPKPTIEMDLTSANNLCIASQTDNSNRTEISIFFLPSIRRTKSNNSSSKSDRNLCFDRGCLTDSPLIQMKSLDEQYIIVSEKNGVGLFDIGCKETDVIKRVSHLSNDAIDTTFAVNAPKNLMIMNKKAPVSKPIIDIKSSRVVSQIDSDISVSSIPLFLSNDIVSFGDVQTGKITLFDVRDGKFIQYVNDCDYAQKSGNSHRWIFQSSFDFGPCRSEESLHCYSVDGNYLVYDCRNLTRPSYAAEHKIDGSRAAVNSNIKMNVCPIDPFRFTICGYDEYVYVCERRENEIAVIFRHDGHSYNGDTFKAGVKTVCSLWAPFMSSQTVISCADNASVQCWQFNIV